MAAFASRLQAQVRDLLNKRAVDRHTAQLILEAAFHLLDTAGRLVPLDRDG